MTNRTVFLLAQELRRQEDRPNGENKAHRIRGYDTFLAIPTRRYRKPHLLGDLHTCRSLACSRDEAGRASLCARILRTICGSYVEGVRNK